MKELQQFNFEGSEVRCLVINSEPWFLAMDVCKILGTRTDDIVKVLDEDEWSKTDPDSIGVKINAPHGLTIISEPGLYSLILRSRKPIANTFRRWVTHEILPEIRKTGSFGTPRTFAEALQLAADQARVLEEKEKQIEADRPKVEFYDAVADSKDAIDMGEAAKVLNLPGFGRNKLFQFLRDQGILDRSNVPYQQYVDRGWFRVIETKFNKGDESHIYIKTLLYQKGLRKIQEMLTQEVA